MARPKRVPQHVEEEDISQEQEELEATEPDEDDAEADEPESDDGPKMTKVDAIRAALAAGKESPDEGTSYIRDRFGIEISKTHWSATKSQLKRREGGGGAPKGKRAARGRQAPAAAAPEPKQATKAKTTTAPGPGMIGDLEAVKSLVKKLGAEQVKRIADLFED